MRLTPTELDRLTIFTAAELARRRRAKGWRLTHPEALALICDEMHEAARGGASYEEVVAVARGVLSEDDVLEGVADLVGTVKLECLFGDGVRVLHVERPIGAGKGGATR
jgi:urease gamma subunit